jgi:hypothetical protein
MTDVFFAPGAWAVFFIATPWAARGSEAQPTWPDGSRFLSIIFAGHIKNAKNGDFSA